MELPAASVAQVLQAQDGRMVLVEDDVLNVVKDIRAIEPSLRVRYSESAEVFVVYQDLGDGREHLVTTSKELDPRVVARVREITSESYNYADELDRLDDEEKKRQEHEFSEKVGEIGERLHHAIRKDLNYSQDRVFLG